jgi:hypothetical protein
MNTNAWNLMILPVVFGLGLGAALGVAWLMIVRAIDALGGHGRERVSPTPTGPTRRWRPVVVGPGHEVGPIHAVFVSPRRPGDADSRP